MRKIIIIGLVILTLLFATSFGYMVYKENQYVPVSKEKISTVINQIRFSEKFIREKGLSEINPTQSVSYNGWIPQFAMRAGIDSFEQKRSQFATISPVFYGMEDNGEITTNITGLERLKAIISGTNTKLVPTISSFSADAMAANLRNQNTINNFLIEEVEKNGYDGVDLNYESTYLEDRDAFFNHLNFLSTELHKRGKVFSVTVLSKWSDTINYGFSPQTRKVQDYAEIAKYADQIRIMAYDFTSQGSANPGAVAPIEWVEQVLQYATNRVNPNKLVLGIPLYGYFWNATEERARALDFRQITELKQLNSNPDAFYSKKNEEAALKYVGSTGKAYFGYHADPQSIQARIDLAKKYGLSNVVFWRLGDDPL